MTTRTKLMGHVCDPPLYGAQAWYINEENVRKLETCWTKLLRQMVNGGWRRLPTPEDAEDTEFRLRYTNTDILHIQKTTTVSDGGANI